MSQLTQQEAERFLDLARDAFDPTMIYLLQLPPYLQGKLRACQDLRALCEQNGFQTFETRAFRLAVQSLLRDNTRPIFPSDFVVCNKKHPAIELYSKASERWGLHWPFFVQVCGDGFKEGSLYFIFRTWQDGVTRLLNLFTVGSYPYGPRLYPCSQAVEFCLDWMPCYVLMDWEIYLSRFEGRVTSEAFAGIKHKFPKDLAALLVDTRILHEEASLSIRMKDKSRQCKTKQGGRDEKSSVHFVSNIFGSKKEHALAFWKLGQIMPKGDDPAKLTAKAREKPTTKTYSHIPTKALGDPNALLSPIGLDANALPGGQNGFTTMFSCNKGSGSFPALTICYEACCGAIVGCSKYPVAPPHNMDSTAISEQERLGMLRDACYTIPKPDMVFYNADTLAEIKRELEEYQKALAGGEGKAKVIIKL